MKNYLTPNEAAELLMVSPITLRNWAQKGMLNASTTAGGHRRYMLDDVKSFAREKGIDIRVCGGNSPRVLIVDDEESFASMLANFLKLKDENIETRIAKSGFEAGQMVQDFVPSIILLDLNMPGMNGFEVCDLIKQNHRISDIRIITMTGDFNDQAVQQSVAHGAETCIEKPIDIEKLSALLETNQELQVAAE